MSFFIKRKLKDGRRIKGRYSYSTDKVLISRDDFEELLNESDVAYEQAKQLQTIIENLQKIKAEAVVRTLDKLRVRISEKHPLIIMKNDFESGRTCAYEEVLNMINECQVEVELQGKTESVDR